MKNKLKNNLNIINPYFNLFENWKKEISKNDLDNSDKFNRLLRAMSWVFAHAIPTKEAITEIIKYNPIVEIFAGSGYWAWVLKKSGCKIEPYDNHNFCKIKNDYSLCPYPYYWLKPKTGTPDILKNNKFINYTLLLCWPPDEDEGEEAAKCLEYFKGSRLLYVGQKENGKTAGKKYFDILKKNWLPIKEIKLPSWSDSYSCELIIYNKIT